VLFLAGLRLSLFRTAISALPEDFPEIGTISFYAPFADSFAMVRTKDPLLLPPSGNAARIIVDEA